MVAALGVAMDGGDAGVQVIIATEAMAMPNTAMGEPTAPVGAIGALLVAIAATLGARRTSPAPRA
jgi:uncharacterized YccA/Bax inhibitor family protein